MNIKVTKEQQWKTYKQEVRNVLSGLGPFLAEVYPEMDDPPATPEEKVYAELSSVVSLLCNRIDSAEYYTKAQDVAREEPIPMRDWIQLELVQLQYWNKHLKPREILIELILFSLEALGILVERERQEKDQ